MINRLSIIIILGLQAFTSFSQNGPIGSWRDHLPYIDAVSVTETESLIYCATNSALFTYDKSDFSLERLNIVNTLSDIGVSKVRYNNFNKKVVVAYINGNIDIIGTDKSIANLPAIKTTSIIGSKKINHIYFEEHLAYLSTGFGIVVLNTDKIEIVETYFFGPLGNAIFTNAVTTDATYIYAATSEGVFFANKNSANLIDFNAWTILPELGVLNYSNIVSFSNRLFTSLDLPSDTSDTLYYNDGGVWSKFIPEGANINNLNVSQNTLLISYNESVEKYNLTLSKVGEITEYNNDNYISPQEAIIGSEGFTWVADVRRGLIKTKDNHEDEIIHPNSPSLANVFKMDFADNNLWTVSGGYASTGSFSPNNINNYIYNHQDNNFWKDSKQFVAALNGEVAKDAVSVAINPGNSSKVFIGMWDAGLLELTDGNVTNAYTAENSALDSTSFGTTRIGALVFDEDDNLWAANSGSNNPLTVMTSDGDWYNYSFESIGVGVSNLFTDILVDNNNYKWIMEPKANGIIVFDHGTLGEPSTTQVKFLQPNLADIPGTQLFSIAEDKDGEIWLGTDEGIGVFYNPSSVFEEDIKAEQIFIEQDGQTQILLESEVVTVITIDGANRKWIGTQTSGVFLMSEDGTTQIEHFTTSNSPLFSNSIFDIAIDPETGEIYIGTEKGLISYKGTATEGKGDYSNVFVYPNPVKPDFNGTIAIRGLLKDTDVRITDISGNIVYRTASFGGQAVWDGKDFNGNKVQTGVYMIFNGSENGDQKAATKVLIYH